MRHKLIMIVGLFELYDPSDNSSYTIMWARAVQFSKVMDVLVRTDRWARPAASSSQQSRNPD
jgi:hypothetical protein